MPIWGERVCAPAIMGTSGITKEQAKTCLYYAAATYSSPEKLKRTPLPEIIGPPGTGKLELEWLGYGWIIRIALGTL